MDDSLQIQDILEKPMFLCQCLTNDTVSLLDRPVAICRRAGEEMAVAWQSEIMKRGLLARPCHFKPSPRTPDIAVGPPGPGRRPSSTGRPSQGPLIKIFDSIPFNF